MAKAKPMYKIIKTRHRNGQTYEAVGTIDELVKYYAYTLECGESWQHEKGNKKINRNPKNIKSLVNNLHNSLNNSAANGYSGYSFTWEDYIPTEPMILGPSA